MLTLFHDYTSPASAIAVARLHRLAGEGITASFIGIEAIGVDAHLPVTIDVLAALSDLADLADAEGVRLTAPPFLPPTAQAHVVGELAEEQGRGAAWRDACYRAFWERGADLADREVLTELADRAGLAPADTAERLDDRRRVVDLRRRVAARRHEGIGGVPILRTAGSLVPALISDEDLRALAGL